MDFDHRVNYMFAICNYEVEMKSQLMFLNGDMKKYNLAIHLFTTTLIA